MLFSYQKLVICGDFAHLYQYSKPIYYGFTRNKSSLSIFDDELKQLQLSLGIRDIKYGVKEDSNVYRSKREVRNVLQCNAYRYGCKPVFITLTFADNIQDLFIANAEFTLFIKRLNYYVFKQKKSILKYLVVPEFQKRGAVHYHIIFFNLP